MSDWLSDLDSLGAEEVRPKRKRRARRAKPEKQVEQAKPAEPDPLPSPVEFVPLDFRPLQWDQEHIEWIWRRLLEYNPGLHGALAAYPQSLAGATDVWYDVFQGEKQIMLIGFRNVRPGHGAGLQIDPVDEVPEGAIPLLRDFLSKAAKALELHIWWAWVPVPQKRSLAVVQAMGAENGGRMPMAYKTFNDFVDGVLYTLREEVEDRWQQV